MQDEASQNQEQTSHRPVLISGSSGLLGTALQERLRQPIRLRRSAKGPEDLLWSPQTGLQETPPKNLAAVVHLAGESIAEGRWTEAKMKAIRDSRIQGTRSLSESLAGLEHRPSVMVSASAIGFYGNAGSEPQSEAASRGEGFLAEVCEAWEEATRPAVEAGIRVVNLRIGVILAKQGGALKKMLLPFKLGLGGKLGPGDQYMSWIELDDMVSVILKAIDDESLSGPVNATAPEPVTNLEFTKTLGRVLRRPTIASVPSFMARTMLGRMADELLLASIRVTPDKLLQSGFEFEQPSLEGALRKVLKAQS